MAVVGVEGWLERAPDSCTLTRNHPGPWKPRQEVHSLGDRGFILNLHPSPGSVYSCVALGKLHDLSELPILHLSNRNSTTFLARWLCRLGGLVSGSVTQHWVTAPCLPHDGEQDHLSGGWTSWPCGELSGCAGSSSAPFAPAPL